MALQPESPALILRGKHVRQVELLGDIEGLEGDSSEVRVCRLAMMLHGADPANDARALELLDRPLAEYHEYVADVLDQMDDGPEPEGQPSGGYHVSLHDGRVCALRPLKGRQRRVLGLLDEAGGDRALILATSNLSEAELDGVTLGEHQAIVKGVGFLFRPVLKRLSQTHSPGTGSSSPSGAS